VSVSFFIAIMLFGGGLAAFFLNTGKASATALPPSISLEGFAWSSVAGWISFNAKNCDTNANGFIDTGACGGSDTGATPVVDYAVSVELPTSGVKKLSGYAWANPVDVQGCDTNNNGFIDATPRCGGQDNATTPVATYADASNNMGWVTFNETELAGCPPGPAACRAQVNFIARKLEGWARSCAVFQSGCQGALRPPIQNGGWDGWISLSGTAVPSGELYGATYVPTSCKLEGYAWGGGDAAQVIDWISFSGVATDGSPYGVRLVGANVPPDPPDNLSVTANTDPPGTFCPGPWRFVFSFHYVDPETTDMSAYEIQIAKNPAFAPGDIIYDSGQTPLIGASGSVASVIKTFCSPMTCPGSSIFTYSTDYRWRVKVWDSGNSACQVTGEQDSPWSAADGFRTPRHDWPKVGFSWVPAKPSAANEDVHFPNTTAFDAGSIGQGFLWTLDGTTPPPITSTASDPGVRRYSSVGSFPATLKATDDVGNCQLQKMVPVAPPLPSYQEK